MKSQCDLASFRRRVVRPSTLTVFNPLIFDIFLDLIKRKNLIQILICLLSIYDIDLNISFMFYESVHTYTYYLHILYISTYVHLLRILCISTYVHPLHVYVSVHTYTYYMFYVG